MKLFLTCIFLFCFIKIDGAYPVVDWISELSEQNIPHPDLPNLEIPHPDIPFHKIPHPDIPYDKIRHPEFSLPESQKLENVRSVLRKGYEFYKAVDAIKDREEYRIIETMDKIPLKCLLETDITVEKGNLWENDERPNSLPKYVWKVAKMVFKKAIDTTIAMGRSKDN